MLSPSDRGFSVAGLNAAGALDGVGVASFRIVASDDYGGTTYDPFVVVIPEPEPGEPSLPASSFVYEDEQLDLPWLFRRSFESLTPFWDTAATQRAKPTNAGATLGRVLFYDKRLSIANTHSCGSCHEQSLGFTTADRFPLGVLGTPLKRNSMTVANSRYNLLEQYFFDMRVDGLERLALMPIEDPAELGNLWPLLEAKLAATDFYPPLFEAAFGTREITRKGVADALAQFLRSIITYRSRFDQAYLIADGDDSTPLPDPSLVLTATELRGAEVFEQSSCNFCHRTELQLMDSVANNGLDVLPLDPGAGDGTFHPPSLRNIAVTAPYMHDGRFANLREVIDHYDHEVLDTPQLHSALRDHLGAVRRLALTEQDKVALEAFLGTLTDHAMLTDPKFSDPF
jgi:cytochrome c peroxidase